MSDKTPKDGENADAGIDIVAGAEPDKKIEKGGIAKAVAIADAKIDKDGPTRARVVASGQGAVAEQILQIAWANNIKVREDADLVEVLSAIDVDSDIPIEAFAAVAEILSYVYRANAGYIAPTENSETK